LDLDRIRKTLHCNCRTGQTKTNFYLQAAAGGRAARKRHVDSGSCRRKYGKGDGKVAPLFFATNFIIKVMLLPELKFNGAVIPDNWNELAGDPVIPTQEICATSINVTD